MGDEQEALAVVDAAGGPTGGAGFGVCGGRAWLVGQGGCAVNAARMAVTDFPLFQVVLQQVAAVVHGLGGLNLEVHPVRKLVDFGEDLLELLAAEQGIQLTASQGNQEDRKSVA